MELKERLANIAALTRGFELFADLEEQDAIIDTALTGTIIVSAVNGKKIRVTSLFIIAAGAVNVRFQQDSSGVRNPKTGQMNFPSNGGVCLPYNPKGWFTLDVNTPLIIELSGAVSVDGGLKYQLV